MVFEWVNEINLFYCQKEVIPSLRLSTDWIEGCCFLRINGNCHKWIFIIHIYVYYMYNIHIIYIIYIFLDCLMSWSANISWWRILLGDFLDRLVAKTLCSHCRGHWFDPWGRELRSWMLHSMKVKRESINRSVVSDSLWPHGL